MMIRRLVAVMVVAAASVVGLSAVSPAMAHCPYNFGDCDGGHCDFNFGYCGPGAYCYINVGSCTTGFEDGDVGNLLVCLHEGEECVAAP